GRLARAPPQPTVNRFTRYVLRRVVLPGSDSAQAVSNARETPARTPRAPPLRLPAVPRARARRALAPVRRAPPPARAGPGTGIAGLQVLAGAVLAALSRAGHAHLLCRSLLSGALLRPGRKCAAHLHQLVLRRHLLGHQRRLDPVEQSLQPANQLSLGDAELGVGGGAVIGERQRDPKQFLQ